MSVTSVSPAPPVCKHLGGLISGARVRGRVVMVAGVLSQLHENYETVKRYLNVCTAVKRGIEIDQGKRS